MLHKAGGAWHEKLEGDITSTKVDNDFDTVELKKYAEELLKNEVSLYQNKKSRKGKEHAKGNDTWMKTVASAGKIYMTFFCLAIVCEW